MPFFLFCFDMVLKVAPQNAQCRFVEVKQRKHTSRRYFERAAADRSSVVLAVFVRRDRLVVEKLNLPMESMIACPCSVRSGFAILSVGSSHHVSMCSVIEAYALAIRSNYEGAHLPFLPSTVVKN